MSPHRKDGAVCLTIIILLFWLYDQHQENKRALEAGFIPPPED